MEDKTKLTASIEAILFAAGTTIQISHLAEALDLPIKKVNEALAELDKELLESGRGIRLQIFQGRAQLTTAPEFAEPIENFLGIEATSKLSRAALEALAIIAYRQPITRPLIDAVRGVNSDGVLRSLLSKGLVEEVGRAEGPGRPILYGVTSEFLQHFGINSLEELPELVLEESEADNNRLLKD